MLLWLIPFVLWRYHPPWICSFYKNTIEGESLNLISACFYISLVEIISCLCPIIIFYLRKKNDGKFEKIENDDDNDDGGNTTKGGLETTNEQDDDRDVSI